MTINLHNISNIKAIGNRYNGNCKPVLCITTGEVYVSLTEAAKANNTTLSNMSWVITGRMKTCKGKRFCLVADAMDHIDEIAEVIRDKNIKAAKYDAEQERIRAKQEANELLEQRKAKYLKLQQETDQAKKLLEDAEAKVNALN